MLFRIYVKCDLHFIIYFFLSTLRSFDSSIMVHISIFVNDIFNILYINLFINCIALFLFYLYAYSTEIYTPFTVTVSARPDTVAPGSESGLRPPWLRPIPFDQIYAAPPVKFRAGATTIQTKSDLKMRYHPHFKIAIYSTYAFNAASFPSGYLTVSRDKICLSLLFLIFIYYPICGNYFCSSRYSCTRFWIRTAVSSAPLSPAKYPAASSKMIFSMTSWNPGAGRARLTSSFTSSASSGSGT